MRVCVCACVCVKIYFFAFKHLLCLIRFCFNYSAPYKAFLCCSFLIERFVHNLWCHLHQTRLAA